MSPKNKLKLALGAVNGLLAFGTVGFKFLTPWPWFECFYFSLITITTIGYGEPPGLTNEARYFATVLIIMGVLVLGYGASVIAHSVLSLEFLSSLGKRRMIKEIQQMNGHYIVCGAGRVGLRVARRIGRRGFDSVIIEKNEQLADRLHAQGYRVLTGDATSEEVLREAGIERAQGLVCAVASDPENLYITLTTRDMNRDILIVARANEEEAVSRLLKAGANKVVSPSIIGSQKISQMLLKPAVADFIELATMAEELTLEIEQVELSPASRLADRSLREGNIRAELDIIIIAIKRADGHMVFNPSGDTVMRAEDVLIAIGSHEKLEALERLASPDRPSRWHQHQ